MVEKTDIEKILTHSVDITNRRIYFGNIDNGEDGSDFNWDSVEVAIRSIHYLSSLNKKPIELHMSSNGGNVYEMLRLYDAIQICPCQIKFFGSGTICSSASYIMAGCDERYLTANATVMVHKGHTGSMEGVYTDVQINMQESEKIDIKCNNIYAANSRMPLEFWNEITHRDLYLTAEEAIMLGIADKIIQPKKRGNLRRSRIAIMNQPVNSVNMKKLIRDLSKRIHLPKTLKIDIQVPSEECDPNIIVEKDINVLEAMPNNPSHHTNE